MLVSYIQTDEKISDHGLMIVGKVTANFTKKDVKVLLVMGLVENEVLTVNQQDDGFLSGKLGQRRPPI